MVKNSASQPAADQVDQAGQIDERLADLQTQLDQKEDAYRRVLADFQNLQRRAQTDRTQTIQRANADLLLDLLPTLDHLEMAMKHFTDPSLSMIAGDLHKTLANYGVTRITTIGEEYNAETMEVVETEPGKQNIVLREMLPGYFLNGNILRHAKVVVGVEEKNNAEKNSGGQSA